MSITQEAGEAVAGSRDDGAVRDAAASASRRWRGVWRLHFYSGLFAFPFILLMAVTGLVILYTQPIQDWTQGDLYQVDVGEETVSYEDQVAATEEAYPDAAIISLTTPSAPGRSTILGLEGSAQHAGGDQAFVDPYTGEVLGTNNQGGALVGLANRLHGFLNMESVTVDLPAVSALWDGDPLMREYVLFDLVLEIFGVWALVLVFSGLFLYWPRRAGAAAAVTAGAPTSAGAAAAASTDGGNGAGNGNGKTGDAGGVQRPGFFTVRRGVRGRARWRDLHGLSGVLLLGVLLLTIMSGWRGGPTGAPTSPPWPTP